MVRPIDHNVAPHTELPAGVPTKRWRIASTVMVNGFTSANASSGAGRFSIGTNADEMNVNGKITMNPICCAVSALVEYKPTSAKIQLNA